jgi:hypothetical protein
MRSKKSLNTESENNDREIFVTECDIQKFFDCVNHSLIVRTLENFVSKYKIVLNQNAKEIFIQYLESYSFSKNVFPLNNTDYFKNRRMEGAYFKWHPEILKKQFYDLKEYDSNLENLEIGVPQGGALSCFISNLLLHSVDESVLNTNRKDILYLRFCDDMIILHTDKGQCEKGLERYKDAIKKLKLLIHEPQEITNYSKTFWKTKSKRPYKWASKQFMGSNVPWLAFVGYQIKYDGSIRVRKKSFEKEKRKQVKECEQVLKALNLYRNKKAVNMISKKSKYQQIFALESRLISMSVGRVKLYETTSAQSRCWTNGFKALMMNRTIIKQLKILDTWRTKNLYNVKKELKNLEKPVEKIKFSNKKFFYGAPFSYHNFILKQKSSD